MRYPFDRIWNPAKDTQAPLKWRKSYTVRVNLTGDETDDQLDRIFAVMALTPKHAYQVVVASVDRFNEWFNYARKFDNTDEEICDLNLKVNGDWSTPVKMSEGETIPNVMIGAHIRTQAEADARIPALLKCPAAKWFAVVEPTEAISLLYPKSVFPNGPQYCCSGEGCACRGQPYDYPLIYGLSFIELRGPTGPNARPMHPQWARQIRDECAKASVEIRMNIEAKAGEA
jgi:protein gp37